MQYGREATSTPVGEGKHSSYDINQKLLL